MRSIVVGTDGSETAGRAVEAAAAIAGAAGARVSVVSAYRPVPESRLRHERRSVPDRYEGAVNPREDVDADLHQAEETVRAAGAAVDTYPRRGDPANALIEVAEEVDADLIVVGNRGMTGARRHFLGSVPDKVSHHAPCSVLIVRTT